MSTSVKSESLKFHIMPESVHNHYKNNNLLKENEIYFVEDESTRSLSDIVTDNGTIISENADFAEVGEWEDGNPNSENRLGYFITACGVCQGSSGFYMRKASSQSDVRGVTMENPAFAANASSDKYYEGTNILKAKYNYVGFAGMVPVIDNGTCVVNGRCMPADDGTAIPSINNLGYQVLERIDESHVLILVEPSADMLVRIKDDISTINNTVNDINNIINESSHTHNNLEILESISEEQVNKWNNAEANANNYTNNEISEVSEKITIIDTELDTKQEQMDWVTEVDIDMMFAGTYGQ